MKLTIWIILFDIGVFYLLGGMSLIHHFLPAGMKLRRHAKEAAKGLQHHLCHERDRLTAAQQENASRELATVRAALASGGSEALTTTLDSLRERWDVVVPTKPNASLRETLEVILVAFAIAFSVRSLFLQPFKIPTGSMQPTLFGMHFTPAPAALPAPSVVGQFFDMLHHSKRYVNEVVKADGELEAVVSVSPAIPYFEKTDVIIGGIRYRLPGPKGNVEQYLREYAEYEPGNGRPHFKKGAVLARGWFEMGDHLFVDRVRLNFFEPQRGDITVFDTSGIRNPDGTPLSGRWYIKRLCGLPGDTLQIRDRQLYVKPKGATAFTLVDEPVPYQWMYSFRGGYRGYANFPDVVSEDGTVIQRTGSQFLKGPDETFTLGDDQYFMLGDNSESSADSRFWGTVPRASLVGRACFTWWPFSRRWGFVDVAEPLDNPTLPTKP